MSNAESRWLPWIKALLVVAALACLLVLPRFVTSPYALHILILILLSTIMGQSWNLLGGYTGQYSVGHAAYFGVGAYMTIWLMQNQHVVPWKGMWAGALAAAVVALVIGSICFRLRGPYFVLASIAVTEIMRLTATNMKTFTNGAEGILATEVPPLMWKGQVVTDWLTKVPFYYAALGLAALTILVTFLVERSKLGYYFVAIREDQDAAHSLGINLPIYKNLALLFSAVLTSLAGAFYGTFVGFVDPPTTLGLDISVQIVLICIIGGIGTLGGPLVGACILVPLSELLRSNAIPELLIKWGWVSDSSRTGLFLKENLAHAHVLIYGILVVVVILFMPEGLVGFFRRLRRKAAGRA